MIVTVLPASAVPLTVNELTFATFKAVALSDKLVTVGATVSNLNVCEVALGL